MIAQENGPEREASENQGSSGSNTEAEQQNQTSLPEELSNLAEMILMNPKLRIAYYDDPAKLLARYLPLKKLKGDSPMWGFSLKEALRAQLAAAMEKKINHDPRLVSFREARAESEGFFNDALRNPQRAFDTMLLMSRIIFGAGVALVIFGLWAAVFLFADRPELQAAAGGVSTAGFIGSLFNVLAMTRSSIRRITGDNVQIRIVMSSFAAELTNIRNLSLAEPNRAQVANAEMRLAKSAALEEIQKYTEPPPKADTAQTSANGDRSAGSSTIPGPTATRDGGPSTLPRF